MSGIFGVVSQKDCSELLFYGTDYHSHLGTEFAGLAVCGKKIVRKIHQISQSQFKAKFYDEYKKMKGNKGIGVISSQDEQPIYLNSQFGPFALCTNGLINNAERLVREMHQSGISFSETSGDTVNIAELVGKMICQGKDFVDGIEKMFARIEGSCSLLLLHQDGIYAARDRFGYSPLVLGEKDGAWAITSETSSFPNLGFKIKKFLQPEEIVLVTKDGLKQKEKGSAHNQICAFLWIYTGFPASSYEGINVETVRERCGRFLAKNDNIIPDVVSGVPDSGTAHAIGYAIESKVPFRRPLVKYTPGYDRSYTPSSPETRALIAKMKLIPIKELIQGKKIVVCEDSIVRGTQLKNYTIQKLWDNGAEEVHIRPACPPLMYPCIFNISTRSIEELVARRAIKALEGRSIENISEYLDAHSEKYKKMVEWIRKILGVTSLKYQTIEDMVKAIGRPKEKLCLYCWNGQCPKKEKTSSDKCA